MGQLEATKTTKLWWTQAYVVYLILVSILGTVLAVRGILDFPGYDGKFDFLLLLALASATQIAATSMSVSSRRGITYTFGPAVSLATVPFYGPAAAAFIEAATATVLWVIKPADGDAWKKSWRQLGFNAGMSSISIYAAGVVFLAARQFLGADTIAGATLPWLLAAIVNDQLNLWLLIGILRLQNGAEVKPLAVWKENAWTVPTGILTVSIGGGLIALALERFDWLGVVIFFLPILLSSITDRLYLKQMQEHMDNLEELVAARTGQLEELLKQKDAFLAVLAHDMKTPLTTVGIYTQMLQSQPQLLAEKPHITEAILRSHKTLTEIVNNIVDLEKLQSDQPAPLNTEDMDIIPVLEYLVEAISAQAQQKNIKLTFDPQQSNLRLRADRQQFERVINNLLSNAIKYTSEWGCIDVSVRRNGESVQLQVTDTGLGIPSAELPYIFEPYRRVKKHKDKAAGTGLGLAISKAIVEAHQGTISVESEEGAGSMFAVTLPLRGPQ